MLSMPLCCLYVGKVERGFELMAAFAGLLSLPLIVTEETAKAAHASFFPEGLCLLNTEGVSHLIKDYEGAISNLYPIEAKNLFAFSPTFHGKSFFTLTLVDPLREPIERSLILPDSAFLVPSGMSKGLFEQKAPIKELFKIVEIGNPLEEYFFKHEKTLNELLRKKIKTPSSKLLLHLYSPSSPKSYLEKIIRDLPENYSLLLPYFSSELSQADSTFLQKIAKNPRVITLEDIPLSYAFFSLADAYLLNCNIEALPALTFNKPLFFIKERGSPLFNKLQSYGSVIDPQQDIALFSWIDNYFSFDVHDRSIVKESLRKEFLGFPKNSVLLSKELNEVCISLKNLQWPL